MRTSTNTAFVAALLALIIGSTTAATPSAVNTQSRTSHERRQASTSAHEHAQGKPQARHGVHAHPVTSHVHTHQVEHPNTVARHHLATQQVARHHAPMRTRHERVAWRHVSQPVPMYVGRRRVVAQVVSLSRTRAIVRLPNGTLRSYIALREGSADRDRLGFEDEGVQRTFVIRRVGVPIAHRVVVVADEDFVERVPELTVVRAVDRDDQELMLVEPRDEIVPFAVSEVQPLPGRRVAIIADDEIPQTFVPPTVSFVGRVIGLANNMVTFLLPDGTTRTLLDTGPLPTIGSQVAVVENGQQVVSLAPAVTNFVGQVVSVDNDLVTFAMPNGSLRALTVSQPAPVVGARVVVFENGEQVQRMLVL